MPLHLSVRPEAKGALNPQALARLRRRAARMLKAAALSDETLGPPDDVEVGLTLTGDDEIHELNRDHRGKDKPTDVLAFAMREGEGGDLHPGVLGDVIISVDTARRQKKKRTLEDELFFLWSHGLCHILGYDHNDDDEEAEMNARMKLLREEGARRGRVRPA
jgi:probable rRNA maturation factor